MVSMCQGSQECFDFGATFYIGTRIFHKGPIPSCNFLLKCQWEPCWIWVTKQGVCILSHYLGGQLYLVAFYGNYVCQPQGFPDCHLCSIESCQSWEPANCISQSSCRLMSHLGPLIGDQEAAGRSFSSSSQILSDIFQKQDGGSSRLQLPSAPPVPLWGSSLEAHILRVLALAQVYQTKV